MQDICDTFIEDYINEINEDKALIKFFEIGIEEIKKELLEDKSGNIAFLQSKKVELDNFKNIISRIQFHCDALERNLNEYYSRTSKTK